ncbi:MAG TPA: DUF481 domain-containing protein [archaeon]|nr:DUF481 domain-containing protein [archaeon]
MKRNALIISLVCLGCYYQAGADFFGFRALDAQEVRRESKVRDESQPGPAGIYNLDSLAAAADSLARAADSLGNLVDSLISRAAKAQQAATPPVPEKKEAKPVQESPWDGNFGLGLTLNRGNTRQSSVVATIRIDRKGGKTNFINRASVTNIRSKDSKNTDKGTFKSKFELNLDKGFFFFSALDLEYNRQAGINLRMAPGLGVGIVVIKTKKLRLDLNFGANPVTEYLKDKPSRTKGHFLATQGLQVDFNGRTRLDQGLTYKPRVGKLNDYLVNFTLSLTNKLTSDFDLNMNLEGKYNSRPPLRDPPYLRQDWTFYTAVAYTFW